MASSLPFMRDAFIQRNALLHEALPPRGDPDAQKRFGFHGGQHWRFRMAMDHCKRFLGLRAVRIFDWNDGIRPFDDPALSNLKIAERLGECRENNGIKKHYMAMYTSIFGGTTSDPAAIVNRREGQSAEKECGTCHTASVMNGFLYEVDHRYFNCLSFDLSTVTNTLIQSLLPFLTGCTMPTEVITSLIWMKLMEFAMIKTILTALSKMGSEENRTFDGIWSEGEQYFDKQIKMNSQAFILIARELLLSQFENTLSCTSKVFALVAQLGGSKLTKTSLKPWNNAGEVMLMGNRIPQDLVLQSEDSDTNSEGEDVAMAQSEYDVQYDDDCDDDDDDDDDCEDEDDDDDEDDCEDDDDDDDEDDDDCEDDDDDDDDDDDECECEDEDDDDDDDEEDCVSLVPGWLYNPNWSQSKSSLVHSKAPI